jgi:hypothetical protein
MSFTREPPFYDTNPSLALPHAVPGPGGHRVTELTLHCLKCNQVLTNLHGTATDHRDWTDFVVAAPCPKCRGVTRGRMRIDSNGLVQHYSDTGWVEQLSQSRWDRFVIKVHRFLSRRPRK